jgi:GNAT superfamily N-acetyltransferase
MQPWVQERLAALPIAQLETCGSYTFSIEPLNDQVWSEFVPLAAMHFEEMRAHHLGEPFNPDKDGRQADCANGLLYGAFIRNAGYAMVGYALIYLFVNRNSGQMQAREDAMFIHPEHRRGRLFSRFMQYLESLVKKAGAKKVRIQVCIGARNTTYVKSNGYREIATIMEKDL